MSTERHVDALIVGGGPAGSVAGATLAAAGVDTIILEREAFPRFHVGESLLPHTVPLLDELGVHDRVKALPHTRLKEGATFVTHDGARKVVYWFEDGMKPAIPHAYQVRRDEFDACLLDNAREKGATVLQGYQAEDPIWEGDRLVGLTVRDPEGQPQTIRSRVFLDASGQPSFLARKMRWRETHAGHRKVAAVTHFKGAWLPEGRESGNITIAITDGGWFWLIPFKDDTISVGAVLDVARWRGESSGPEALFNAALARTPEVARRVAGAERILPYAAVQNFSFTTKRVAGDGFCLIGDSAGFLDPIFSTGVFLATTAATSAAREIIAALRARGRVDGADLAGTVELTRHMQRLFFSFIKSYYDPHFLAFFFNPKNHVELQAAVTSLLAADVIGPETWKRTTRFRVVQSLARLQSVASRFGRHLVEPLDSTPS